MLWHSWIMQLLQVSPTEGGRGPVARAAADGPRAAQHAVWTSRPMQLQCIIIACLLLCSPPAGLTRVQCPWVLGPIQWVRGLAWERATCLMLGGNPPSLHCKHI